MSLLSLNGEAVLTQKQTLATLTSISDISTSPIESTTMENVENPVLDIDTIQFIGIGMNSNRITKFGTSKGKSRTFLENKRTIFENALWGLKHKLISK